ncbi:hypothetical protein Dsin_008079 [Dipteronia sinensis]|uniref:Uncharacterized protein n=1 Tax=Dipteronia sinensis TaxID=43782 RepID=A0AAE0EHQ1_9ROSI|nr:hypothetical protein Dsin_008079 [Dipteronia sinensis]
MKWGCGGNKETIIETMTSASASASASSSTSRLSPLAPPFNFKNHDAAPPLPHNIKVFHADELELPHSSEYNSSPARVFKTSGVSRTISIKPVLPKAMDTCGASGIINNDNYPGTHSSAMTVAYSPLNAKDQVVHQVKIPTDKGMEEKNHQLKNGAIDSLTTEISELLISSQNVVADVSLESHGAKSCLPVLNTSVMSNQKDSDVDSPCWKGTGAYRSPFQVTEPLTSRLPKTETGARKRLNPLAPHFIPESARQLVEYHANEYDGSDSLSFQHTTSSVVSLSSTEYISTAYVKTGTCPSEMGSIIETHYSNGINDAGKEYVFPNESNINSLLDYSPGDQRRLIEDPLSSNCLDVMGPNVAGPVKSIKDAMHRGSTNVSFAVTRNALTSPCSRDAVSSNFNNALRGASKRTPPKIDVQLLISTMHDLSELLICNHLDTINEHEHDMIQHIINNLNACITNEVGQRVSELESGHSCTSYSTRKLSDCYKVTRMKPMTVPQDQGRQKSSWSMFSKKVPSPCPRRDGCIKRGDDVTKIIGKAAKHTRLINEEMNCCRALYGNLFIEAEAEAAPGL